MASQPAGQCNNVPAQVAMDAPSFAYHFFLSRRGSIAATAQEVADVLEAEDYRVRVQDYDFASGGQFVADIDDALKQARDLLILYSRDYHGSFWTRQEFHNFLAEVATANGTRRIGLLRCDDDNPSGLLSSATYGDLHNVADPAERRRIILGVARGEAPSARPTPRIFGGATMPPENLLFTGRKAEQEALHTALLSDTGRAALTQAAVHGLGGVGKTSLARAYVARFGTRVQRRVVDHRHRPAGDLDRPAWAGPRAGPGAAGGRQAGGRGGQGARNAGGAAWGGAVPAGLRQRASPELLDGLVPKRGAAVLATSRAPDWSGTAQEVFVDTLPEDAAVEFLQRRAERQDADGARRLAVALGCLPLALDHAGAYVRRATITFDAYAQRVAERIQAAPPRGVAYPRSVAATFALAIEEAAREAPAAETLLGLLCLVRAGGDPAGTGGRGRDARAGPRGRGDGVVRRVAADAGTGRGMRAGGVGASAGAGGDAGEVGRAAGGGGSALRSPGGAGTRLPRRCIPRPNAMAALPRVDAALAHDAGACRR